jgi:hypothetical protein
MIALFLRFFKKTNLEEAYANEEKVYIALTEKMIFRVAYHQVSQTLLCFKKIWVGRPLNLSFRTKSKA